MALWSKLDTQCTRRQSHIIRVFREGATKFGYQITAYSGYDGWTSSGWTSIPTVPGKSYVLLDELR